MKKIKLLQIITKLELGGAQLSVLELIRNLDKNIYEIHLISADQGILIEDAKLIPQIKIYLLRSLRREIDILFDLKALFDLYKFIKKEKFDIVHTHSSKAGILGRLAAKLAGARLIVHTVHGWGFHQYQNKIKKIIFIILEKAAANITDKIIAVTNYDIKKGLHYRIGSKGKYDLIRYGIDKEKFRHFDSSLFKERLGISGGDFVVGMIACFKPQKSPLDFVRAAQGIIKQIPNVRFILVGDGRLRSRIEKLIKKINLEDKFALLGWRRDIPEILSTFDILALPSLWEGLPVVFLEAMAGKKPIVATNICGNYEVIQDGFNGFLVEPRNHQAFSNRIIYLLENINLRKSMGENGRSILNKNFDIETMVSSIHNLYLCNLKKGGGENVYINS